MDDLIWTSVWSTILSHAFKIVLVVSVVLGWISWGIITAKWRAGLYDRLKSECNLEQLLDTPQRREAQKMEGNLLYCDPEPEDEYHKDKICPTCGEIYRCTLVTQCIYDNDKLQPYPPKPITEPLPVIQAVDTLDIPDDIREVWQELELTAEYYSRGKPCPFTREEVLKLCALESKWSSLHQERQAL